MDRFAELKALTAVVEAGGFAAAARDTGQSRSAVNRLVMAMEERLGVQLLHRTTRSVSLTSNGLAIYEKARLVLEGLDDLEQSAGWAASEPTGRLRISAPPPVGRLNFPDLVVAFMARYPRVRVEAQFDSRFVDMVAEGYDAVVRVAPPDEDANLVDHRVFTIEYVVCARRDYLERSGTPRTHEDLREHEVLCLGPSGMRPMLRLIGPDGLLTVPVRPKLSTNSMETLLHAVRAGFGVAIVPAHDVRNEIYAGQLVKLLDTYDVPSRALQVIYPPTRHLSASVRLFTEFVIEHCRSLGPVAAGVADRRTASA